MFIRSVIAVFLALVIANPACCCAFRTDFAYSSTSSSSCCSEKPNDSKDKDNKSCTCSIAKEKAAPEADVFAVVNSISNPVPTLHESLSIEGFSSAFPETITSPEKWPPGRMPVPTHGSRLAAKCSYLI